MDVLVQLFIDPEKWDAAQWKATAFFHDPSGTRPPCLGIVFENIDAGRQIFSDWLKRVTKVDRYDEIRISIVEGEILGQGPGYSVHISSDPDHTAKRPEMLGRGVDIQRAVIIGRVHRMTPEPRSPHLPRFKREFAKHKKYLLLPVSADLKPEFSFAVEKAEVLFRNTSEITADDPDAVVFPEHYFDGDQTIQ